MSEILDGKRTRIRIWLRTKSNYLMFFTAWGIPVGIGVFLLTWEFGIHEIWFFILIMIVCLLMMFGIALGMWHISRPVIEELDRARNAKKN